MGESKVNHKGQTEDNREDLVTIKTQTLELHPM